MRAGARISAGSVGRDDIVSGAQNEPAIERIEWDGRVTTVTWLAPPFRPTRRLTTQALGLCFTPEGQIVLVTADGDNWTLPGGHPEPGETLEAALERELREEACARLVACEYIGCQRVEDPDRPDGPGLYYQARFWARVELYPFEARYESLARHLVSPDAFLDSLAWGHAAAARLILAEGLRRERQAANSVATQG
jgi:8-oxo-dGTP diphosphatase